MAPNVADTIDTDSLRPPPIFGDPLPIDGLDDPPTTPDNGIPTSTPTAANSEEPLSSTGDDIATEELTSTLETAVVGVKTLKWSMDHVIEITSTSAGANQTTSAGANQTTSAGAIKTTSAPTSMPTKTQTVDQYTEALEEWSDLNKLRRLSYESVSGFRAIGRIDDSWDHLDEIVSFTKRTQIR